MELLPSLISPTSHSNSIPAMYDRCSILCIFRLDCVNAPMDLVGRRMQTWWRVLLLSLMVSRRSLDFGCAEWCRAVRWILAVPNSLDLPSSGDGNIQLATSDDMMAWLPHPRIPTIHILLHHVEHHYGDCSDVEEAKPKPEMIWFVWGRPFADVGMKWRVGLEVTDEAIYLPSNFIWFYLSDAETIFSYDEVMIRPGVHAIINLQLNSWTR